MAGSLVATVGKNPMPVLLSVLTHHLTTPNDGNNDAGLEGVILLHTVGGHDGVDSGGEAASIKRALHRLVPGLNVRLVSVGESSWDLQTIQKNLDAELASLLDGARPIRVDYTGGTVAMCAALVDWHLTHGGRSQNRSYVDNTTGFIRKDNDDYVPILAPPGLDLSKMAEVHGFVLVRGTSKTENRAAALLEAKVVDFLMRMTGEHRNRVEGGDCEPCKPLLNTNPGGTFEVLANMDVFERGPRGQPVGEKVSQFDGLVRWGHRVLTVEAKCGGVQFYGEAGWSLRRTEAVFGSAAQTLLVYEKALGPRIQLDAGDALLPRNAGLRAHLYAYGTLKADTAPPPGNWLHTFFPNLRPPTRPSVDMASAAAANPTPLLVTAVGASMLAPLAAAAATSEAPESLDVRIIPSNQHSMDNRDSLKVVLSAAGYTAVEFTVADLGSAEAVSTRTTQLLAGRTGRVWVDVTAGTKAATAGMVSAVHERGDAASAGELQVVATDPRTRHVAYLGKPSGRAQVTCVPWAAVVPDGFTDINAGPAPRPLLQLMVDAVIEVLPAGYREEVTRWSLSSVALMPDKCDLLALTVQDRIVLLVQPTQPEQQWTTVDPAKYGEEFRRLARIGLQADAAIAARFGDAAVTILSFKAEHAPPNALVGVRTRLRHVNRPSRPLDVLELRDGFTAARIATSLRTVKALFPGGPRR
jgi:hypothetical protein